MKDLQKKYQKKNLQKNWLPFPIKIAPFFGMFQNFLIKCAFDNSRYWLFIEPQKLKVIKTAGNFVYQLFYWSFFFFSFLSHLMIQFLSFFLLTFLEFTFLSLCTVVPKLRKINNKYLRKQRATFLSFLF